MKAYYTELDRKDILIMQRERHLSAKQLKDIPMFFIVGRPRSGTTLLRTLFDAHPNVIVPAECQLIVNLYPKYGKITNWTRQVLEAFYHDLYKQWRFDVWPVDRKSLYRNLMACEGENTYSTIIKVVYFEYHSIYGHNFLLALGDKNPGYTIYTEKLLKIFPEAKFIHIIRDYRDNFVSIRNVDFELPIISLTVAKWKHFIRKFRKAAKRHPGTHLEIRYEDLVSRPEETFRFLCEFINIPFSNAPFSFYKKTEDALKVFPKKLIYKYHASLLQKVNKSRIGLWRKELSKKEIRIADAAAGKLAESTGHKRAYPHPGFAAYLRSMPGKFFSRLIYFITWLIDGLPYNIRMNILSRAPLVIGRFYLSIFNREKLKKLDEKVRSVKERTAGNMPNSGWSMAVDRDPTIE
ncbi:MAG: sulfotransferase [Bacteroidales bacterium]|jgi:hypothetical protein|nr:sulfotransferase [Bacteroidales bacterium]